MEGSNWEIKKQAIAAEHQLGLRQSETGKNARIGQLEREVQKLKIELEDAHEEVERLTVALEAGVGLPDDIKASRGASVLGDEEEKTERRERKPRTEKPAETSYTASAETPAGSGSAAVDTESAQPAAEAPKDESF